MLSLQRISTIVDSGTAACQPSGCGLKPIGYARGVTATGGFIYLLK